MRQVQDDSVNFIVAQLASLYKAVNQIFGFRLEYVKYQYKQNLHVVLIPVVFLLQMTEQYKASQNSSSKSCAIKPWTFLFGKTERSL